LNSGGFSNPQREHRLRKAAPQLPQNFIPAGLSVLQLEHRIAINFIPRDPVRPNCGGCRIR
jgi:hypothetical protein